MVSPVPLRCDTCLYSPCWGQHAQCAGCLYDRVKPCEVVPKLACHWDLAVAHAEVRRYYAEWEQAHPGWALEVEYEQVDFESTAPSKYVDRETTIGRKLVWSRCRVVRRHPRGRWWWPRPFVADAPWPLDEVPALVIEGTPAWLLRALESVGRPGA